MGGFHKRSNVAILSWRETVLAQQAGGQTVSEFCKKRGISACSFYAWRKRLGMNNPVAGPEALRKTVQGAANRNVSSGFLRLNPDMVVAGVRTINKPSQMPGRVLWIDTPGGYRISVDEGVELAGVVDILARQAALRAPGQ